MVEHYLTFRALDAGETLFYEGERGDYMAVVVAGNLDVFKKVRPPVNSQDLHRNRATRASRDRRNSQPKPAGQFGAYRQLKGRGKHGEMSVIDEMSRSATVMASERTGLIILPKRTLTASCKIGNLVSIHLRRTSADLSKRL